MAIALGDQSSFGCKALAGAALTAGIGGGIAGEIGPVGGGRSRSKPAANVTGATGQALGAGAAQIAGSLARAAIDETTYAIFTGGKINYAQIVGDAFGNAVGDGIVQAEAGPQYGLTNEEQQQEYGDINAGTSAAVNQDSKQIADAAGRSLFAQNAPLTDNLQLSDPEVQPQNITVDLNSVPLSAVPSIGAETSAPANDAFTQYWNGSVAQLTGGVSPSVATAFNQMLSGSGTSGSPQAGGPTGFTLPPIEEVGPGYFETQANTAFSEAANPNNSLGQRAIFGLLGLATEPMAMFESVGRSIESAASVTGQEVAQAQLQYQAGNTAEGNIAALGALEYGAEGFTVAGSLLIPGPEALANSPTLSETASAIGNRVQQGFSHLGDLFAGSAGSLGNSGAPFSAQLGKLDLSGLVPGGTSATTSAGSLPAPPITFDQIMENLKGMDFSTAPNSALFYSGPGTGAYAQQLAADQGLSTISSTEGGAYLESLGLNGPSSPVSRAEAKQLWSYASQQYANGASGDVTTILSNPSSDGIYLAVEKPILNTNTNITSINEITIPSYSYPELGNFH